MSRNVLTNISRLFVVCFLLILFGCGEDVAPVAQNAAVKKAQPIAPKQVEVEVEEVEEDPFIYRSFGQRDPFVSLLKKEQEAAEAGAPKTPLEKFDLGQFRIQAILIGKGVPRAMVSAPDGKNYILKPGLKIGKNSGVIIDIIKSAIVIEETTIDLLGNVSKGLQSLTIPEDKSF